MIAKYDTSFSSSGKSSTTTLVLIGLALVGGYFVYKHFFAKPKEPKNQQ